MLESRRVVSPDKIKNCLAIQNLILKKVLKTLESES
ncbi:MAG: hypothetical protein QOJ87_613, partial [Verrucomicrobiota bacterium]